MSLKVVPRCVVQSGPYPKPLGPEDHVESLYAIAAQAGGLGGGAGSTVPLK
jgi:hypothetical protein